MEIRVKPYKPRRVETETLTMRELTDLIFCAALHKREVLWCNGVLYCHTGKRGFWSTIKEKVFRIEVYRDLCYASMPKYEKYITVRMEGQPPITIPVIDVSFVPFCRDLVKYLQEMIKEEHGHG